MNYVIEANLGFVFFFGIYYLLMRNETDFRKQRVFLLTGLICSLIFPFIHVQQEIQTAALITVLPEFVVNETTAVSTSTSQVLFFVYALVVITIASPLLFHVVKLYRTARLSGTHQGGYYVIESRSSKPSWSFFNVIFIGQSDQLTPEEKGLIVKHEMLHGRLRHSLDILFITILCLLCWFNPILWIYRRTLSRVHEFEVDAIVARESNSAEYGILLAKTALSGNGFILTHHFNQSFILKRINMLNMLTRRVSNWKLAALATTIILYFAVVSCTEQLSEQEHQKDEVFTIVDESARPIDGMKIFFRDISNILQYPEEARRMGVQGKVFVEFTVNTDGSLSDFKVLKGIGAGCDKEAIRVISQMKAWIPGKVNGKVVAQKMVLPMTFMLN